MKSTNNVSLHLKAMDKFLEPGFLFLPLLLVMHLGLPLESVQTQIHPISMWEYYCVLELMRNELIKSVID